MTWLTSFSHIILSHSHLFSTCKGSVSVSTTSSSSSPPPCISLPPCWKLIRGLFSQNTRWWKTSAELSENSVNYEKCTNIIVFFSKLHSLQEIIYFIHCDTKDIECQSKYAPRHSKCKENKHFKSHFLKQIRFVIYAGTRMGFPQHYRVHKFADLLLQQK